MQKADTLAANWNSAYTVGEPQPHQSIAKLLSSSAGTNVPEPCWKTLPEQGTDAWRRPPTAVGP